MDSQLLGPVLAEQRGLRFFAGAYLAQSYFSLAQCFALRIAGCHQTCLGQLIAVWHSLDNSISSPTSTQPLCAVRLHFPTLASNQDEMLAASERVTLSLSDLNNWVQAADQDSWPFGRCLLPGSAEAVLLAHVTDCHSFSSSSSSFYFPKEKTQAAISKEQQQPAWTEVTKPDSLDCAPLTQSNCHHHHHSSAKHQFVLLSYGQYCRFRALLKRFQSQESLVFQLDRFSKARQHVHKTKAIGHVRSIRVFFCRETFEERQLRERRSLSEGAMPTRRELRPRNAHLKRLEHLDLQETTCNIKSDCESIIDCHENRLPKLHTTQQTPSVATKPQIHPIESVDLQRRTSSTPCSNSSEKENQAHSGEHDQNSPPLVPSSSNSSSPLSSSSLTSSSSAFTSLVRSKTTINYGVEVQPESTLIATTSPEVNNSNVQSQHPGQQNNNSSLFENGGNIFNRILSSHPLTIDGISSTVLTSSPSSSPPQPLPQILLPQLATTTLPAPAALSTTGTTTTAIQTLQTHAQIACLPASCVPLPAGKTSNLTTSDWPFQVQKNLVLAERILSDENEFNRQLFRFMKSIGRPIHRVPHLGFKKLNLFAFFRLSLRLGGYQWITWNRNWKRIYDSLGGDQKSTSAATCTRRHYEALLLPFERYVQQLRGKSGSPIKEVTKLQRGRKPKILIERSEQIERLVQLELDNQAPLLELENLDHNSLDALTERLMGTMANKPPITTSNLSSRSAILPRSPSSMIMAGIPPQMSSHSPPSNKPPTLPACTLPGMVFTSNCAATPSAFDMQHNKMLPPNSFLEQTTKRLEMSQHLSENQFNSTINAHTMPSSPVQYENRLPPNGMTIPYGINNNVTRQATMDASFDLNLLMLPRKRGRKPKYMKEMEQQLHDGRPRLGSLDSATFAAMTRLNAFHNRSPAMTSNSNTHFGPMSFNNDNNVQPMTTGQLDLQPLGRIRSQSFGSHREISQQQMNDEQIVRMLEQRYAMHRQRNNSQNAHRNADHHHQQTGSSSNEPSESRLANELEYLKNRYHQLEQLQQLQQQKEQHQKQQQKVHQQQKLQQQSQPVKPEREHKKESEHRSELLSLSNKSESVSPLPPNKRRLSEMADQMQLYEQQSPVLDLTMPKKKASFDQNETGKLSQETNDVNLEPLQLQLQKQLEEQHNREHNLTNASISVESSLVTNGDCQSHRLNADQSPEVDSLKLPDLNNNQSAIQAAANEYLLRCYQQLLSAQQNVGVGGLIQNYPSNLANFPFINQHHLNHQQQLIASNTALSNGSTLAEAKIPTQDLKHSIPNLCGGGLNSSTDVSSTAYKQFLPSFPF